MDVNRNRYLLEACHGPWVLGVCSCAYQRVEDFAAYTGVSVAPRAW